MIQLELRKMINNLAIVQARMSSKRLPGKVIKNVEGEPLIIFLLKRLLHSKKIDQIVLVTSNLWILYLLYEV